MITGQSLHYLQERLHTTAKPLLERAKKILTRISRFITRKVLLIQAKGGISPLRPNVVEPGLADTNSRLQGGLGLGELPADSGLDDR